MKAKKGAPIFWNPQFPISQPIQNPLVIQPVPLAPNPPIPMILARFAPLALPAVLHDLYLNYAQIISLYDGKRKVVSLPLNPI